MSAIVLTAEEVRRLLPMEECMDRMAEVLQTLGRGRAQNPLRSEMMLENGKGLLGLMPGYVDEPSALGLKVVAVFPENHGTDLDSHQGLVCLFDGKTGVPTAILDASEVTAIRTAAVSGVATRLLARADAGDLALIGTGVQGHTHLEAMAVARSLRSVRVYSRDRDRREAFAAAGSERFGIEVRAVDSAREAVDGADLICTTTTSAEPVIENAWIADGAHVNAVGSSVPTDRELDSATVARSRLFVDRRESTLNEGGEYLFALREGAIAEDHIVGELGEVLLGEVEGRRDDGEVTLFESLGLAVEDLASAHHVLERARAEGVGLRVDLSGAKR